jgi:hypothetical protein
VIAFCGAEKKLHTKIEDELGDLADCDVLLPPDADAARALEVVPVHDNVDSQVQGDDGPRNRGVADELRVAEHSGRAMVVSVEEGCDCQLLRISNC